MSMKATVRQVNSVTVIDLSGRITLGEGCSQLRELIRDLLGKGHKQMLLNLADVTYIDSSGIGELVSGFTAVSNQGGQLKLLNLTKKVHDLLQITKLLTVFDVHEDEAKAIASYDKGAGA
ncbi:MAG TPA: STAS domain-containing protein [Terriglobia bacterium]|nr:STAS domain-containing protein [Terriglobia bacterium]